MFDFDGFQEPGKTKASIGFLVVIVILILGGIFYWQKFSRPSFYSDRTGKDYLLTENDLLFDSDQDGLSDEQEKRYGTDPYLIDTDGDGHDDLVEINNGFNPLGVGKLSGINVTQNKIAETNKSNKKIYRNYSNSYQIEYPATWSYYRDNGIVEFTINDNDKWLELTISAGMAEELNQYFGKKREDNSSFEDYLKFFEISINGEKYLKKEKISLGGNTAYKYVWPNEINIAGFYDESSSGVVKSRRIFIGFSFKSNSGDFIKKHESDINEIIKSFTIFKDTGLHRDEFMKLNKILPNSQVCQEFKTLDNKDKCFYSLAKLSANPVTCNMIESLYDRNDCIKTISSLPKSISECANMAKNHEKNQCYLRFAVSSLDDKYCEKISVIENPGLYQTFPRNDCYRKIALFSKNVSGCDKISDSSAMYNCYIGIDKSQLNYKVCDRLEHGIFKINCYKDTDISKINLGLCKITAEKDPSSGDICYVYAAQNSKDKSTCNFILDENLKRVCHATR